MIKPEQFGAIGNGIADDTAAMQAACNALSGGNKSMALEGTYAIRGNGKGAQTFRLKHDGPAITFQISAGAPCYYTSIQDVGFYGTGTANQAAIKITGTNQDYFSHCSVDDVTFCDLGFGIYCDAAGTEGENKFSWNIFSGIDVSNTKFPIYWKGGTGTGNVISDGNFVVGNGGVGIRAGDGIQIVGDLTINDIQFGGTATGIKLVGGKAYGDRITLTAMQWDAGINPGLDATNIHNLRGSGVMLGGGATVKIRAGCSNIVMDGTKYA